MVNKPVAAAAGVIMAVLIAGGVLIGSADKEDGSKPFYCDDNDTVFMAAGKIDNNNTLLFEKTNDNFSMECKGGWFELKEKGGCPNAKWALDHDGSYCMA